MRARGRRSGAATTSTTRSCAASSCRRPPPTGTDERPPLLEAFEVLYEADGLPSYLLPFDLERIYGGIGFGPEVVYSNFVTSIDGVASLGDGESAGSVISGKVASDRFVMGLLRACADAVLIGAGTLKASHGHRWTPAHVAPQFAESFAALRNALGRSAEPRLVITTARGDVDLAHGAVKAGATIVTSEHGAKNLEGRLPDSCDVLVAGGADELDLGRALGELRGRGYAAILTEGGPRVMGHLLRAGALDEVFLTVSPLLAGRDGEERPSMVEGVELAPRPGLWTRLLSARRHGAYLFLRYSVR